jgi:uncharacterized glyoxalase superfamily protein PhnB
MTTFYPSLRYRDAHAAIDWLSRAFGFTPKAVYEADGVVAHAELTFGDGMIMLGTQRDDRYGDRIGQGWTYVAADDVDALCEQAIAAGAEVIDGLHDTDYGSRDFAVLDPEGNRWNFGTYRPEP